MPPMKIQSFTADGVRQIAKALASYSTELAKIADEMDGAKLESLRIKAVGELVRADKRISLFCDNGRIALRQALRPEMFGRDEGADDDDDDSPGSPVPKKPRGRAPKAAKKAKK